MLDDGDMTHVISGIIYGADAYFRFEKVIGESSSKHSISGELKAEVAKLPQCSAGGGGGVEVSGSDKATEDNLTCTFFGDYKIGSPPTTFQGAIKTLKEGKFIRMACFDSTAFS